MILIDPSTEFLTPIKRDEILPLLERIGRICYKSEDKITENSASKFVRMIADRGHHAMLEHYSITVKFTCDRGVSHEIVRHRIASYAQESTRYCDYTKNKFGDQITFIRPLWFEFVPSGVFQWEKEDLYTSSVVKWILSNVFKKDTQKYKIAQTYHFGGNPPIGSVSSDQKALWNHPEIFFLRQMLWSEDTYKALRNKGWKPEQARAVLPNSLKTEIAVTMNLREWMHFFAMRDSKFAHPQMQQLAGPLHKEFKAQLPEIYGE